MMRRNIWIFLPLSLFSFVFVFTAIICTRFLTSRQDKVDNSIREYKFLRINPTKKESSRGMVTFYQDLRKDEYITFDDPNGDKFLISNFGTKEYVCKGYCFCQDRRTASNSIISRKAVFFLVAALGSLVAYQEAEDFFEDDCQMKMSEFSCYSSVKSEIDSCDEVTTQEEYSTMDVEKIKHKPFRYKREYWCHGNCIVSVRIRRMEGLKMARELCKELKREGEVKLDVMGDENLEFYLDRQAKLQFQKQFLTDYCRKTSKRWYFVDKNKDGKRKSKKWYENTLCVAYGNKNRGDEGDVNPSVRCIQRFEEVEWN